MRDIRVQGRRKSCYHDVVLCDCKHATVVDCIGMLKTGKTGPACTYLIMTWKVLTYYYGYKGAVDKTPCLKVRFCVAADKTAIRCQRAAY